MIIQLDLQEDLNRKLKIDKAVRGKVSLSETIIEILNESLFEKYNEGEYMKDERCRPDKTKI